MNRAIKFRAMHEDLERLVETKLPKRNSHTGIYKQAGYVMRLVSGHPFTNKRGYVCEHRLVVEESLGRFLTSTEFIHHIDQDKANNDISNLRLYGSQAEHAKDHADEKRRTNGQFHSSDPQLEQIKFRLKNNSTGAIEIRTLANLINTTFNHNRFEFRGRFTGLKDKDEAPIFEGDVIYSVFKKSSGDRYVYGPVYWDSEWAGWSVRDTKTEESFSLGRLSGALIHGNIHENPDLAQGAKGSK